MVATRAPRDLLRRPAVAVVGVLLGVVVGLVQPGAAAPLLSSGFRVAVAASAQFSASGGHESRLRTTNAPGRVATALPRRQPRVTAATTPLPEAPTAAPDSGRTPTAIRRTVPSHPGPAVGVLVHAPSPTRAAAGGPPLPHTDTRGTESVPTGVPAVRAPPVALQA
ncbi:hypothetical protein [Actinopolymorpha alba]|uniref:hypothetical protein n=1 Tax=Actinopolymorpha alba TaxID=533267 RepID=UPI00039A8617|nr:hypothetical protein [Actinopolymorpha alba]